MKSVFVMLPTVSLIGYRGVVHACVTGIGHLMMGEYNALKTGLGLRGDCKPIPETSARESRDRPVT